jgi:uncharacterized membrane protein YjjP (DUF1212 family)
MTIAGAMLALLLGFPLVRGIADLWRRRWVWGALSIAYFVLLIFTIDPRGLR